MLVANKAATETRPPRGHAAWRRLARRARASARAAVPTCPFERPRMTTREDDIAYFRRRLASSERQAGEADTDAARAAHLKLADHYREKLIELGAQDHREAD